MIASHGAGKLCVAFILLPARRCWLAQQPRHTKHTHTEIVNESLAFRVHLADHETNMHVSLCYWLL